MMRKVMVTGMAIVCCVSLQAMKGPERGSFVELKKWRKEQLNLKKKEQPPRIMQRGKKIVQMLKESDEKSTTSYRAFFSTGNTGLCTYVADEARGSRYYYKEWTPEGVVVANFAGEDAAIKFSRYAVLHNHALLNRQ